MSTDRRRTVRLRRAPRPTSTGGGARVYPPETPSQRQSVRGRSARRGARPDREDWGSIARIYDLEHPAARGAELRFWDELAQATGGPVLELAAGSGRIAVALARKGHEVTGLELSEGMLQRARGRTAHVPPAAQERLRWVQGDMARFDLPDVRERGGFGLVFVAYNSFWLLQEESQQEACLACARRHLKPGGRLVIDVFPPVDDDYKDEQGIAQRLAMANRGRAIVRVKDYTFDPERRLAISDVRYYGETTRGKDDPAAGNGEAGRARLLAEFRYALRIAPPHEVQALLERCGFNVLETYGTYEKDPLTPDAPRAIFVCEAA